MKITMSKIAEIAGVHRSTVDKVVHNRPGVSELTRRRVQKVIEDFSYQKKMLPAGLNKTTITPHIIAFLLDVDSSNEISKGMWSAMEEYEAFNPVLQVRTISQFDVGHLVSSIEEATAERVHAIMIQAMSSPRVADAMLAAKRLGIKTVTVNADLNAAARQAFIGQDMRKAGRTAGSLLAKFIGGQGKVASLTTNNGAFSVEERQIGFEQVIRESYPDITLLPAIETHENAKVTFNETIDLLADHPDLVGLFNSCGKVSSMCRAVEELERQNTLKIVTFETYPDVLDYVRRDVITCTIGSNPERQGYEAVKSLLSAFLFDKSFPDGNIYIPFEIVVKENVPIHN